MADASLGGWLEEENNFCLCFHLNNISNRPRLNNKLCLDLGTEKGEYNV